MVWRSDVQASPEESETGAPTEAFHVRGRGPDPAAEVQRKQPHPPTTDTLHAVEAGTSRSRPGSGPSPSAARQAPEWRSPADDRTTGPERTPRGRLGTGPSDGFGAGIGTGHCVCVGRRVSDECNASFPQRQSDSPDPIQQDWRSIAAKSSVRGSFPSGTRPASSAASRLSAAPGRRAFRDGRPCWMTSVAQPEPPGRTVLVATDLTPNDNVVATGRNPAPPQNVESIRQNLDVTGRRPCSSQKQSKPTQGFSIWHSTCLEGSSRVVEDKGAPSLHSFLHGRCALKPGGCAMTSESETPSPSSAPAARVPNLKLLAQLGHALRVRHYSRRTERAYSRWVVRFVRFHGLRHPVEMAEPEVSAFLTDLAVRSNVGASTQNQALCALLFLYREVLGRPLGQLGDVARARMPRRLPVVLTRSEVQLVLRQLSGEFWLMANLMYGAGLRLMECLQLRVKDVDFRAGRLVVREGKGGKDRVTLLPELVCTPLREHMDWVRAMHGQDLMEGYGRVMLPNGLARKFPNAAVQWGWQWVFPQGRRWVNRQTHQEGRHHVHETTGTARGSTGGPAGGTHEEGDVPHAASLFRHPLARERLRHPYRPGVAGARGRKNDHDLHARAEPWVPGGPQSG